MLSRLKTALVGLGKRLLGLALRGLLHLHAFLRHNHTISYCAYGIVLLGVILSILPGPLAGLISVVGLDGETIQELPGKLERAGHLLALAIGAPLLVTSIILGIIRRVIDPMTNEEKLDVEHGALGSNIQLQSPTDAIHFEQLVEMGEYAFAAWGGSREQRSIVYKKFNDLNPKVFKLIHLNGQTLPIGFSCVLPISEEACRKFRLGQLDTWEFAKGDILDSTSEPTYLCINAIFLRRAFRKDPKIRAVRIICRHIADIASHSAANAAPASPLSLYLIADGLTIHGRRFLKRYGFETSRFTKGHTPLFTLDFSRSGIFDDRAIVFRGCLERALKVVQDGTGAAQRP